jgi:thiamine-phosphate diphosphorylase
MSVTPERFTSFGSGRHNLSLYLIADREFVSRARPGVLLEEIVEQALSSGCISAVQLRDKNSALRSTLALGKRLRALCHAAGVPFLVNDRFDLALALEADGIHIGQQDMPLAYVQKLVPQHWILGASAGTLSEIATLERESTSERPIRLDYIGCGPVFGTNTKADAGSPIGTAGIARVVAAVEPLPVIAIGGVGCSNAQSCIVSGKASGIACIAAILGAEDPKLAAQSLYKEIQEGYELRKRAVSETQAQYSRSEWMEENSS